RARRRAIRRHAAGRSAPRPDLRCAIRSRSSRRPTPLRIEAGPGRRGLAPIRPSRLRVLIVGAGAVGSLIGWALADGGLDVALVRRRAPASRRQDLAVVRPGGRTTAA